MKKFAGIAAALALTLSLTTGAKAWDWSFPSKDISIKNTDISVTTNTSATSQTGGNHQWSLGKYGGDVTQNLTTGVALSDALAQISVASTFMPNCGCDLQGDIKVENKDLHVTTNTGATSQTGGNYQWGLAKGWSSDVHENLTTGDAGSTAKSGVTVAYTDFSVSTP